MALDDYGTGFANMTYLTSFPISTVKLDRSFVQAIEVDQTSRVVVKTLVGAAKTLNLRLVAEGVETASVAHALKDMGIDYLQGYLYGKAMPAAALIARFRALASRIQL
ncbi:EAL domain-containing protein [Paraburkholderia sp. CNPSo 3155]|nr:EAL domain-containing protein [Paraburkholderia atlantica]NUY35948.1 EAL domain-containing protein [Paraburkholderia atlantica]